MLAQDIERFWSKVDRQDELSCWEWTGRTDKDGYGVFIADGEPCLAHRVAYVLVNGPIPFKRYILHSCDNPPCCNPSHTRPGTPQDNVNDMRSRGRKCSSKLNDEKVVELRKKYQAGGITQNDLAWEYGVTIRTIANVVNGRSWKHLPLYPKNRGKEGIAKARIQNRDQ